VKAAPDALNKGDKPRALAYIAKVGKIASDFTSRQGLAVFSKYLEEKLGIKFPN
jgi:hypothetical protein